jgi:hypothetical protein
MVVMNALHMTPAAFWFTGNSVLAGSYLRTTDSLPAFSPKERVAMNKGTRLNTRPIVLLALLVLVALLAVHRRGVTAQEAEDEVVGEVVKVEDAVFRHKHAGVALVGLVALSAFVMWRALRAQEGQDKAVPPARESSAGDKTGSR